MPTKEHATLVSALVELTFAAEEQCETARPDCDWKAAYVELTARLRALAENR